MGDGGQPGGGRPPGFGLADELMLLALVVGLLLLAVGGPLLVSNECKARNHDSAEHIAKALEGGVPQVAAVALALLAMRRWPPSGPPASS